MSIAVKSQQAVPAIEPGEEREPALPFRGDTLLGVCEAVGQDLGIHPNWLRIPFAALLLWNPAAIVACYLGLGVIVAAARWLFPPVGARAPARSRPGTASETGSPRAARSEEEKELLAA